MSAGKEILKKCLMEVIESGEPVFVVEDNPRKLSSLLVRLYRLRNELKKLDPWIEEKVEIGKSSPKDELQGVMLSKPAIAKNMVLRGDGKGGWKPFKKLYPDRELERLIAVMKKDGVSLREAIDYLTLKLRAEEVTEIWERV